MQFLKLFWNFYKLLIVLFSIFYYFWLHIFNILCNFSGIFPLKNIVYLLLFIFYNYMTFFAWIFFLVFLLLISSNFSHLFATRFHMGKIITASFVTLLWSWLGTKLAMFQKFKAWDISYWNLRTQFWIVLEIRKTLLIARFGHSIAQKVCLIKHDRLCNIWNL